jgi:hypothetical protein
VTSKGVGPKDGLPVITVGVCVGSLVVCVGENDGEIEGGTKVGALLGCLVDIVGVFVGE